MNSLPGVSDEVIEHCRQNVGVGRDWEVDWCANKCGEVVFYPPGARAVAEDQGTPFLLTCSNKCTKEILAKRG